MATLLRIDEKKIAQIITEIEEYKATGDDNVLNKHIGWDDIKEYLDKDAGSLRIGALELWLNDNPHTVEEEKEWRRHCQFIFRNFRI